MPMNKYKNSCIPACCEVRILACIASWDIHTDETDNSTRAHVLPSILPCRRANHPVAVGPKA